MDRDDAVLADELLDGADSGEDGAEEEVNLDEFFQPATAEMTPRERAMAEQLQQIQQYQQSQQVAQMQQQHNTVLGQISQLPPDQQQTAQYLYKTYLYAKQKEWEANRATNYARQLEGAAVPLIKKDMLGGLSAKAKIEKAILEKYGDDPRTARAVAGALVEYRKSANLTARQNAGVDNVPGAGAAGAQSGSRARGDVKTKFANTGDLEGFLRAGGLNR